MSELVPRDAFDFVSYDAHPHPLGMGGVQVVVYFRNGYGASVIDSLGSYGVELAVLGPGGHIDYSTPVTDDVIGWLDEERLYLTLRAIESLPPKPHAALDKAGSGD